MRKLKFILSVLLLAFPLLAQAALEFHQSQTEKKQDWVKKEYEGKPIWINPNNEMDSSHIASVKLERTEFYEQRKKEDEKSKVEFEKKHPGSTRTSSLSEYQISLKFSPKGSSLLKNVTTKYCGSQLAITHNGNVLLAPTIREPIVNGEIWISVKNHTKAELEAIVKEINADKSSNQSTDPTRKTPAD